MNYFFKVIIISVLFLNHTHSQIWKSSRYIENENHIFSNIDNFERENYTQILSIPIFKLKEGGEEYDCGKDLFCFVNFSNDTIFQRIVLFNKDKVTGSYEPNITEKSVRYIYADFSFDMKKYEKILKSNQTMVFEIYGIQGLWKIEDRKIYRIATSFLRKIKLIPSSDFVSLNYGSEYINDIIKNTVPFGKKYFPCK